MPGPRLRGCLHESFHVLMAVEPFDDDVGMNAGEFALPLLDEMRRRDDQHNLIGTHSVPEGLDDIGRNRNGGCSPHGRLSGAHLTDQQ